MSFNADIYKACRQAMIALGAKEDILQKYKDLKREDLKTDTAIMNANEPGYRNDQMSWIWHIRHPETESNPSWLKEYKISSFCKLKN